MRPGRRQSHLRSYLSQVLWPYERERAPETTGARSVELAFLLQEEVVQVRKTVCVREDVPTDLRAHELPGVPVFVGQKRRVVLLDVEVQLLVRVVPGVTGERV